MSRTFQVGDVIKIINILQRTTVLDEIYLDTFATLVKQHYWWPGSVLNKERRPEVQASYLWEVMLWDCSISAVCEEDIIHVGDL